MLVFNYPGIGMAILGGVIGMFAANSMHGSPFAACIGGAAAAAIDFMMRSGNERAWFHPNGGGISGSFRCGFSGLLRF